MKILICILVLPLAGFGTEKVVQSKLVRFPTAGVVLVQAVEEHGHLPEMRFTARKGKRRLFSAAIQDPGELLGPASDSEDGYGPFLRFRVLNVGPLAPIVMAVAKYPGGSDDAYYLSLFTEVRGRLVNLSPKPLFTNIQGGWYFGYLGKRFGYALAAWNFIWGDGVGESHYARHRYQYEIYRIKGDRLARVLRRRSGRYYDSQDGYKCLREIGISVTDQRRSMPKINETLLVDD